MDLTLCGKNLRRCAMHAPAARATRARVVAISLVQIASMIKAAALNGIMHDALFGTTALIETMIVDWQSNVRHACNATTYYS